MVGLEWYLCCRLKHNLGACDYSVELPHWTYCSWFDVLEFRCGWVGVVSVLQLLMMDILMSKTCWAHKK